MAINIQDAKIALRQQIKQVLMGMSIEEKLLQSNYVAGKVRIWNASFRFYSFFT